MGARASLRTRNGTHPRKASERDLFCLLVLTNSNGRRRKPIRVRGWADLCTPPPPATATGASRREQSRAEQIDYGVVRRRRRRIQASTSRASEGGEGPALGRGAWPAVLVLEFLEACAVLCCAVRVRESRGSVRTRRGGGWRVDRSHLPTVGRFSSSPHLLRLQMLTPPRPRIFTSSALLPACLLLQLPLLPQ